jgi:hypothetical protein
MKSLIATAALSLLALSTIAEAQPQKNQFNSRSTINGFIAHAGCSVYCLDSKVTV